MRTIIKRDGGAGADAVLRVLEQLKNNLPPESAELHGEQDHVSERLQSMNGVGVGKVTKVVRELEQMTDPAHPDIGMETIIDKERYSVWKKLVNELAEELLADDLLFMNEGAGGEDEGAGAHPLQEAVDAFLHSQMLLDPDAHQNQHIKYEQVSFQVADNCPTVVSDIGC